VPSDACSLGGTNRRQNLWCHSRQAPNVMFPHTVVSAIHIACLAYNQSISQAKQIFIALYVTSESDVLLHRDHPPPMYRMPPLDCPMSIRSSVNNRLWKFKDQLWNNLSFTSLPWSIPNFTVVGTGVWVYSPQTEKKLEFCQYTWRTTCTILLYFQHSLASTPCDALLWLLLFCR